MKTYKHLYPQIYEFKNLLIAYRKARRGKRFKDTVSVFDFELEKNLYDLQEELINKTYEPGVYHNFIIYEPKERLISAAPFKDRVVHHAICNIIEPIFDRSFIYDSYACRNAKGTHKAIDRCQVFLRKNKYVLKCDIKKYFPSIDHNVLLNMLGKKIVDKDVLDLLEKIINSKVFQEEYKFYGDLFNYTIRFKGIPIGNLTSQLFANIYLNELDQFVKHTLKSRYYVRYMDDFVIFSDDKLYLHKMKEEIGVFLQNLKLKLNNKKCIVFPYSLGVDFLGFHLYRKHRKIRKLNIKLFIKKMKRMQWEYAHGKKTLEKIRQSIESWIAHAEHANSYNLRKQIFERFSFSKG